jgi:hypothetical protein
MIALCPFTKIAWPRGSGYSARTTPTQKTHKYLEMHASRNFLNEKQEHEQSEDGCVGQAESLVADGAHVGVRVLPRGRPSIVPAPASCTRQAAQSRPTACDSRQIQEFTNKIGCMTVLLQLLQLQNAAVVVRERARLSDCNCLVEQRPQQQRSRAAADCRLSS